MNLRKRRPQRRRQARESCAVHSDLDIWVCFQAASDHERDDEAKIEYINQSLRSEDELVFEAEPPLSEDLAQACVGLDAGPCGWRPCCACVACGRRCLGWLGDRRRKP